ncbi:DUF2726 domain-containing protein [Jannaschia sp. S6380]|uniref:DUF2726 domain-containing protein n=1 Tax=Jannaschia sp. S6380 TaxID=2926408 RepID=UPI001FF4BB3E|nr:DUF2726 domain-containing protein [Jannaschia sp. S6380]MCK0167507.1 DUF2726 domain-containing protein [Jannaschia sp. S6380]
MEPIGMSLIALSTCGMALRRATAEPADAKSFPAHRVTAPRASLLSSLAACTLRARPLVDDDTRALFGAVTRFAGARGLTIDAQVSLAALLSAEGETAGAVATSLRQRRVDFVISRTDGTPICGIEVLAGDGPTYRDAVRHKAFVLAGLPLVTLNRADDWIVNRDRLVSIVNPFPDPANGSDAPEQATPRAPVAPAEDRAAPAWTPAVALG